MILSKMDKINNDSFNFVILYSARDCFNCLEMEIPILNEMQNKDNVSVYGYYSKEKDSYLIDRITELLPPMFPISTLDSLVVDQIITPTILVLKSQKENTLLLDAHVPIPNDLDRTKAFYQKWNRIIDNSWCLLIAMFSKKLNIQDDIAKSIDRYLSSLPDPSPNWPYDIKTVVQYIYANLFDENLTVQSIIEHGRYNPSSFSGRFRFYVKHNPKQFIDNHRHILAQKLLAIPRVKVVDVAMAIGYRSHHAFTLSFRRRHSCTPSMYMDMIEEEIASDTM